MLLHAFFSGNYKTRSYILGHIHNELNIETFHWTQWKKKKTLHLSWQKARTLYQGIFQAKRSKHLHNCQSFWIWAHLPFWLGGENKTALLAYFSAPLLTPTQNV